MPRDESGGDTGGRAATAWSADVVDHRRTVGEWPFAPAWRPKDPLARRDGLSIVGAVGSVRCVESSGRTRWTHRCAGRPNAAHLPGDRVLVTTDSMEYTPWGLLGPALLLDLADGRLVAELRGERGAVRADGRFVLGLDGYDFFDTWEYDRDGTRTDAWRSYGHYVAGTGLRVVETNRESGTDGWVVRLLPGGVVERGARLTDRTPPEPLVLRDGTILVLDGTVVRAVGRGLDSTVLAELAEASADLSWSTRRKLWWDGDGIAAVVAVPHADDRNLYTVDTWKLTLRHRA